MCVREKFDMLITVLSTFVQGVIENSDGFESEESKIMHTANTCTLCSHTHLQWIAIGPVET